MREANAWLLVVGLVIGLVLVWGSAAGRIPISLPVATLIGLGVNAAIVLWVNREKMEEILCKTC